MKMDLRARIAILDLPMRSALQRSVVLMKLQLSCVRSSGLSGYFVAGVLLLASSTAAGETFEFGDFSFTPGLQSANFNPVFDLTLVNVSMSYKVDLSGVTKTDPALGPYLEVGLREVGAEKFQSRRLRAAYGRQGWMDDFRRC